MGTLGTYLRTARETRGLDLREAAQQTRISYAYLSAIENEDFSKLPGEVFVKGFLKNYARFLGVPEEEVVRRYAELRAPSAPVSAAAVGAPKQEHSAPPRKDAAPSDRIADDSSGTGFDTYLWGAVVVIVCASLVFAILPGIHSEPQVSVPLHTAPSDTAPVVSTSTATVRQDKLYLEVTALEDVWVLVRTDASPQKKAVLKKGETVTWSADERFLVSFASAGAAKLQLNGKELALNMPMHAVVRDLAVTAAGIIAPKVEIERPKPRKPKPAISQPQATTTTAPSTVAPSGDVNAASPGTERPLETTQPSGAVQ
ncbi:MAG: DUF4115 domain-containing protein [Nitrospirota bacterium]|nr:DUF4115 domain-containing protein [Nitrospirota bacterium]